MTPPPGDGSSASSPIIISTEASAEAMRVDPSGKVGIGTPTPRNPLGIRATGVSEELMSFESPAGTTKWHLNQNLSSTAAGLNFVETGVADGRLFLQAGGNVGVNTTTPSHPFHVNANAGIRQNNLHMSGGSEGLNWSSVSFNAYHNAANGDWVFPDPTRTCVTIEIDDHLGSSRFDVYTTTTTAPTTWVRRFYIDGNTGRINVFGDLTVSGQKNFVQEYPSNPTKQIVYVSLEGGEAGTYIRGNGKLEEGKAVIDLPEHFGLVTSEDGLSIQLTPRGQWLQLYAAQLTTSQLIVQEAQGKSGEFDYFIQGLRKGYEHHEVIQEKE
jgi:hypothetical protein